MYLDNTPHELVNLKSLKQGGFAEMFIMNWVSSSMIVIWFVLTYWAFLQLIIIDNNLLAYWAFPQALFTVELEIGLQIEALHKKCQKGEKQAIMDCFCVLFQVTLKNHR